MIVICYSGLASDGGNGSLRLCRFLHDTIFDHGAQNLCDTPSLGKTPARAVGRIAIEDLGNMTQARLGQMSRQDSNPFPNLVPNLVSISIHFEISVDKRPE